jgi:hypothetical protein
MVAQQLERDNVENTMETINRSRDDDSLVVCLLKTNDGPLEPSFNAWSPSQQMTMAAPFLAVTYATERWCNDGKGDREGIDLSQCGFDLLQVSPASR